MAYGRGAAAVKAIEDVSLEIARGEFIAVVGPSGCGKSSLMKLVSGLHPPLAGTLTLEGRPVTGPLKSGGMQQRASICRALIHEPEILMLDEPFGALDAFTREELWCTLRDLQAERKVTVMLVTHDLREAVFLADTVYVMSNRPGRILRRCEVTLPRPRDLEVTYTQPFQDIVHELRALIGKKS